MGRALADLLLMAWPPYRRMLRDEAAYLAEALGPSAYAFALAEADDALAPRLATFMRRVARRIPR